MRWNNWIDQARGDRPSISIEVTQGSVEMPVGASIGGNDSFAQWSYSGESQSCIYAPGRLGPVKLNFLVDTVCTHNLLSKATLDHLPTTVKERLEPWDTTAMLADGSGHPVYGKIILASRIRNASSSMEFFASYISEE